MTGYLTIKTDLTETLILYKNIESVSFNDFEKTIAITATSGKEYVFRFLSLIDNPYNDLKENINKKFQMEA